MAAQASVILGELRQDHKNMALLLRLIDSEADNMHSGGDADFDLLNDVMTYMTAFPDAVHHPKEDRLYAELKLVRPDLSEGMSKITNEHRTIAELGVRLRETIEEIVAGQVKRRNAVVEDALRYVHTLRNHMRWEERDLFRRLDQMIRDGHDAVDEAVFVSAADPLFGQETEQRFARLYDSIDELRRSMVAET